MANEAVIRSLHAAVDGALEIRRAAPRLLACDEVRIAVEHASTSARPTARWPRLGTEYVGIVTEVGSAVSRLQPGDRVVGGIRSGACATEIVVPGYSPFVIGPRPISPCDALTAGPGLVATVLVAELGAPVGATTAVLGAGGSASWIVAALLKASSSSPLVVCRSDRATLAFRGAGFDAVEPWAAHQRLSRIHQPVFAVEFCGSSVGAEHRTCDWTAVRVARGFDRPGLQATAIREVNLIEYAVAHPERIAGAVDLIDARIAAGSVQVPLRVVDFDDVVEEFGTFQRLVARTPRVVVDVSGGSSGHHRETDATHGLQESTLAREFELLAEVGHVRVERP